MSSTAILASKPHGPSHGSVGDALPKKLFRDEAVEAQQIHWLGSVMLEPKPTLFLFTAMAVIMCGAAISFLIFASYTSKARVKGWLVPDRGLARIAAPQSGTIQSVFVQEGGSVTAGAALLGLSGELRTQAGGGSQEEAVRQLKVRKTSLTDGKARMTTLAEQHNSELRRRHGIFEAEIAELEKEISIQQSRVKLIQQTVERERRMRARDLISLTRLQRTEQESLEAASRLASAERSRQSLFRDFATVEAELTALPNRTELQIEDVNRQIAALNQQISEAETKRELLLVSPIDGQVANLQAERGSAVQAGTTLLNVIPEGSVLIAQLFASSQGSGFLKEGQRVRLRYRPYPYQKFGFHEGKIINISRAAISPAELPTGLATLSSFFLPNEPIYRLTVELKRQHIRAYGQDLPLQAGTEVEADVLVEKRRMIEWLLDPVWTATIGRAQ